MPNSTVLSRFTFSSISIVYKFTGLIWFQSLISFNSPTYSMVLQIQLYYLISQSHLIQQSHTFNSVTNSVLLSTFTFISHSTIPTYSTMKQIQQSYLFYIISYSTVPCIQKCNKVNGLFLVYILIFSTVALIQKCHKFSCIIYFHVHISFNSPNIFNNETNSTVLSDLTV